MNFFHKKFLFQNPLSNSKPDFIHPGKQSGTKNLALPHLLPVASIVIDVTIVKNSLNISDR